MRRAEAVLAYLAEHGHIADLAEFYRAAALAEQEELSLDAHGQGPV